MAPNADPSPLALFNEEVTACRRCLRLRRYCEDIGRDKRRAYRDWVYWSRPVPSFGDEQARVLILGLAPGAHGSNRTGRPFTGDGSGNFLFPVLFETGFASQPTATSANDGLVLRDCWISAVVRCAPPGNKPQPEEMANCAPHLDREIALLSNLRVVVCLGRIAFDGYLRHLARHQVRPGQQRRKAEPFSHGAELTLPDGRFLIASFHPSLQNTNTGKLTRDMLLQVFSRARTLADGKGPAGQIPDLALR